MKKTGLIFSCGMITALASFAMSHESSVTKLIGPKGGEIALQNRRVVAIIPPGTLKQETSLQIFESTSAVKMRKGAPPVITHVYRFLPDIEFETPARIRMYCDEDCPPLTDDGWELTVGRLINDKAHIEPDNPLPEWTHSYGQNRVPAEKYVELTTTHWNGTRLLLTFE